MRLEKKDKKIQEFKTGGSFMYSPNPGVLKVHERSESNELSYVHNRFRHT